MALNPTARINDLLDHGGQVIQGSPSRTSEGRRVARVTDAVNCAIHGYQTIVTGCPSFTSEGLRVARVTSVCSCGAIIITGSPNWKIP